MNLEQAFSVISGASRSFQPQASHGSSLDMLDNAPIITCQHRAFTVEGYSRAAVQSYWRIPELRLCFDLGAHHWDFMGTSTVAITHSHLDDIAALPFYVARRLMMKIEPLIIY